MRSAPIPRPRPRPASTCQRSCSRSTASAASRRGSAAGLGEPGRRRLLDLRLPEGISGDRGGGAGRHLAVRRPRWRGRHRVRRGPDPDRGERLRHDQRRPVRVSADRERDHLHRGPGRLRSAPAFSTASRCARYAWRRHDRALRGTVIGCGFFAENHLNAWASIPTSSWSRCATRSAEGRERGPEVRGRASLHRRRHHAARAETRFRRHRDHGGFAPALVELAAGE